jgi:uncharacterized protein (UPF0297 family)
MLKGYSGDFKEYFVFVAKENKARLFNDCGLLISWDDFRKRIIRWERFATTLSVQEYKKEIENDVQRYLSIYLCGIDNTPAYNWTETGEIDHELLASYRNFLSLNKTSKYQHIISDVYNMLKQNKYRINKQIVEYIGNHGYDNHLITSIPDILERKTR